MNLLNHLLYKKIIESSEFIPISENLNIYKVAINYLDTLGSIENLQAFPHYVENASQKRKKEFLAGRLLCQAILFQLDENQSITRESQSLPVWPRNYIGSISHTNQYVIAAVAKNCQYLGIDIEDYLSCGIVDDIKTMIVTPQEIIFYYQVCKSFNRCKTLTLFFSIKESLYKAIYSKVKSYIDFLDVSLIDINIEKATFHIKIDETIRKKFKLDTAYQGGWQFLEQQVITWIHKS